MSDRPDDIPQDAWDAATEVSYLLWAPKSRANYYTINIARAIDQARREGYAAGVALGAEAMTDEALLGLVMRLTAGHSHPDVIRHQITKWRADVAQKETP